MDTVVPACLACQSGYRHMGLPHRRHPLQAGNDSVLDSLNQTSINHVPCHHLANEQNLNLHIIIAISYHAFIALITLSIYYSFSLARPFFIICHYHFLQLFLFSLPLSIWCTLYHVRGFVGDVSLHRPMKMDADGHR